MGVWVRQFSTKFPLVAGLVTAGATNVILMTVTPYYVGAEPFTKLWRMAFLELWGLLVLALIMVLLVVDDLK